MEHNTTGDIDKCPFMSGDQKKSAGEGTSNRDWWPNELKLNILRQNASKSNPMGNEFEYAKAFAANPPVIFRSPTASTNLEDFP